MTISTILWTFVHLHFIFPKYSIYCLLFSPGYQDFRKNEFYFKCCSKHVLDDNVWALIFERLTRSIKEGQKFRIYSCTCAYTINFGTCTWKKTPTKQLAKQTCLFHKAKRQIKRSLSVFKRRTSLKITYSNLYMISLAKLVKPYNILFLKLLMEPNIIMSWTLFYIYISW